jgi:hypothetical protein
MEENTIEYLNRIQENIVEGNYDVANDLIDELKIGIMDGTIELD